MSNSYDINKADLADLDDIEKLYNAIHDREEAGLSTIGWQRDIYPTRKTAEESILRGDMFILKEHGVLLAAGIINKKQLNAYSLCKWTYDVPDDNVMVLHTLVVNPAHSRKGIGRRFVKFYEDYALSHGCHVLRLDTQAKNKTARALYGKLGFSEAGIVECDFFNGISKIDLVCIEKMVGN